MAKTPKIDVAKLVGNLKIDSKIAEDLARGAIAEPEKMAEATQAMLKNASPLYWFSLQQRFAQEHLSLMARMFVPTAGADTNTHGTYLAQSSPILPSYAHQPHRRAA